MSEPHVLCPDPAGTSTFSLTPAHPGMPARCRTADALVEVVAID